MPGFLQRVVGHGTRVATARSTSSVWKGSPDAPDFNGNVGRTDDQDDLKEELVTDL